MACVSGVGTEATYQAKRPSELGHSGAPRNQRETVYAAQNDPQSSHLSNATVYWAFITFTVRRGAARSQQKLRGGCLAYGAESFFCLANSPCEPGGGWDNRQHWTSWKSRDRVIWEPNRVFKTGRRKSQSSKELNGSSAKSRARAKSTSTESQEWAEEQPEALSCKRWGLWYKQHMIILWWCTNDMC